MEKILKVGAVILKGKKFMVVREKGDESYIMPGGRPEAGETAEQTLRREIKEELNAEVKSFSGIGRLEGPSTRKDTLVSQDLFLTEVAGDIKPSSEIEDIKWVGSKPGKVNISTFIQKVMIPKLLELGLIK